MIIFIRIISIFLLLAVLCSAGCKEKGSIGRPMNAPSRPIAEIKKDVFIKGDIAAYNELSTVYLNYPPEDFSFWALLMANRYNYPTAYLDVFYALKDSFNPEANNFSLGDMDTKTKAMALDYLKQAVEMKVETAAGVWERVQQENVKN